MDHVDSDILIIMLITVIILITVVIIIIIIIIIIQLSFLYLSTQEMDEQIGCFLAPEASSP